jgi:hypothetical protein
VIVHPDPGELFSAGKLVDSQYHISEVLAERRGQAAQHRAGERFEFGGAWL